MLSYRQFGGHGFGCISIRSDRRAGGWRLSGTKAHGACTIFRHFEGVPEFLLLLVGPGQYTIIDTHLYLLAHIGQSIQTCGVSSFQALW
jgi:hypothetical protein